MRIALSTNWNAQRHEQGEALVDEIVSIGFDALELGYHTRDTLVAGILKRVNAGAISVESIHAYCPVPLAAPHGYPELYLLASLDEDERVMASILIGKTLTFAESMGAKAVVLHAGRVFLKSFFSDVNTAILIDAAMDDGGVEGARYQNLLAKALRRRAHRVRKYYDGFSLSLEALLPRFEKAGIALCLENLPSIEAFPNEREMVMLKQRFNTPALAYWHDLGHGQVRENLGWISHLESARALLPFTRGVHIHDAVPLDTDHLPPGEGAIDFGDFSFYVADNIIKVFEPSSQVSREALEVSVRYIRQRWASKTIHVGG